MAKLTITDAARVAGVSRVTLHRYIKAGKLSRSADGTIDTAELLRIGLVLQSDTVLQPVSLQRDVTPLKHHPVTSPDPATLQQLHHRVTAGLDAAHAREEAAREREALLLQMLSQMQQQNQRLLDMPRPAPQAAPRRPQGPTPAPQTLSRESPLSQGPPPGPPRRPRAGHARAPCARRIVALLQDHPEGLTRPPSPGSCWAAQRPGRYPLGAMARDGLLQAGRARAVLCPRTDLRDQYCASRTPLGNVCPACRACNDASRTVCGFCCSGSLSLCVNNSRTVSPLCNA